jgi:gamma-glutamylaminecyclotransferase
MADAHLVFVYGSLKRGEHNHRLLSAAEYRGEARTERQFRLYALPHFPALLRDDKDPQEIVGEVYAIDDVTLRLLDRLEANGRLYQRELIRVDSLEQPHESLLAWAYLYLGDLRGASLLPDPRWSGRRGK